MIVLKWFLLLLLVEIAVLAVVVAVGYFLMQTLLVRLAEHIALRIEQGLAGVLLRLGRGLGAGTRGVVIDGSARVTVGRSAPAGNDAARRDLERIERLARLMDNLVPLPIVGGVGIEAALGLIPVVGDVIGSIISLLVIRHSLKFVIPRELKIQMIANALTDLLVGLVPVLGDLADVAYKANTRNVTLLKKYLRARGSMAA